MIHHLESKYFADTAEWFDGPIRQQFEIEMSRAGLVTGRSRYLDDPGPSGPGWVIELKGGGSQSESQFIAYRFLGKLPWVF
jgi:hypothetical protein